MACDVSLVAMFDLFYLPKKGFFIVAMMTNDFCAWNCCWCCNCIIIFLAATFSSKKLARVWIDSGESNSFGLIFLGPQSYEKRETWVHSAQLPSSSFSCTKSVAPRTQKTGKTFFLGHQRSCVLRQKLTFESLIVSVIYIDELNHVDWFETMTAVVLNPGGRCANHGNILVLLNFPLFGINFRLN